ncbi:putative tetratricopeptide-like helical domain-containing protein [Medicago truncatula]|uniref:PPR containing plant-like protein n=1 Tax=Medicago truncatula TaxID=3880 RepID=A0A072UZJ9_MEDTR|nr:pentatricopeptide repeat-containing protein At4g25270, chloroplastic [Medicago truncatula]XP_024634114.1 pentatricopeptide repeat-containing protein At4g25270, chloroplastic [Medicago truncatula]KEH34558.1 PPR containing plant-like protein [Medicago truncatula]RHN68011.1 putative tetratricopeptide-like helical domain-containing protein [Medicago truncatula]
MASSWWYSTPLTTVTNTTRCYSFTSNNDQECSSINILSLLYTAKKNTDNKKLKKLRKWDTQKSKNTFSYPKPKPTPLLIHQQPYPQTKFQALEQVLNDLEASLEKGIKIDPEIYASLLETCYRFGAIHHGIWLHRLIPPALLHRNVGISSKLVRLYASFGYMDDAHDLFDQMTKRDMYAFPWNSLISGYAEMGLYDDAIALYFQMVEEGVEPDIFTFPRVLKVCGGIGLVGVGEEVHRHVVRCGFWDDGFVLNALVDMYSKCGDIVKARKIFNKMHFRDSVSWNSMLTGYVRHGLEVEAINIFRQMVLKGEKPDYFSISAILTSVSSLDVGVQIHGWVIRQGVEWNLSIANSLIIAYSKHGRLDKARSIFNLMPERDVVSWNSIISSHCKHPEAISYFEKMEEAGEVPDKITFVSLLSACAHLGLVNDGERLFALMCEKYKIKPIMEHYGCMVNLYGRAGLVEKAYSIIVRMDSEAVGPTLWGALLYACLLHGNVTIGEISANKLFELEPDNEHNFVLLMKIYEKAGRLEDMERIRMMMVDRGLDH